MKKLLWMLLIPLAGYASKSEDSLFFLVEEDKKAGKMENIDTFVDEEEDKEISELLGSYKDSEKKSDQQVSAKEEQKVNSLFPWIDEEGLDDDISSFIEEKAQEVYRNQQPKSKMSVAQEKETDMYPSLEQVPSRANRFSSQTKPKMGIAKPEQQPVEQKATVQTQPQQQKPKQSATTPVQTHKKPTQKAQAQPPANHKKPMQAKERSTMQRQQKNPSTRPSTNKKMNRTPGHPGKRPVKMDDKSKAKRAN